MLRNAASKVAWVGRTASTVFGIALVMALILGAATTAFGANGQNFVLGKLNNAATAVTGLVGNVDGGAALRVTNPNPETNDTALDLRVQTGEAPMRVNSSTRVDNLNAATAGRADSAASADQAVNATVAQNAANAGALDDLDSSAFQKRVSAQCPAGQSVRSIGADGTVACEQDDDVSAYARVINPHATQTPTFDDSRTSGFALVARNSIGYYCLEPQSGVHVRGRAVAVSIDWHQTAPPEGTAAVNFAGDCGTNGIAFQTERLGVSNGVLTSDNANGVGFHVVVP